MNPTEEITVTLRDGEKVLHTVHATGCCAIDLDIGDVFAPDGKYGAPSHPYRALVFGPLVITWIRQGAGASFVDKCWGSTLDGRRYSGRAIHLQPWRKNRHGDRLMAPALVLGWIR